MFHSLHRLLRLDAADAALLGQIAIWAALALALAIVGGLVIRIFRLAAGI